MMDRDDPMIDRFMQWGAARLDVRAMVLTSTRAVPGGRCDLFSDYDVIMAVRDIRPFYENRAWLDDFGPVLVVYRDPIQKLHGEESFAYITQYENGLKIDFTLWPIEILHRIGAETTLPDDLDVGYRVLLDKDGLTRNLHPPSYKAHIPPPPTLEDYLTNIEVFFHEATYVAKHLWRGDLLPAKYCFDHMMKQGHLRPMLEWRIELDHAWTVKPGTLGKGLKDLIPHERWVELERTYVGPGLAENWDALFRTIAYFRKIAWEVGNELGFDYPEDMDRRTTNYLEKVRELAPDAVDFPPAAQANG